MDDGQEGMPEPLAAILGDTRALGFEMASEVRTGALLACLAASKPGGRLLEIGTGTGVGTSWLLAGMSPDAILDTVDDDRRVVEVAQRHLGSDPRVRFHVTDARRFISSIEPASIDLVYADAIPGKFVDLDLALGLLTPGGVYVIDDLLPQPNWPDGHAARVPPLLASIEGRRDLITVRLAWASGLMLVTRRPGTVT